MGKRGQNSVYTKEVKSKISLLLDRYLEQDAIFFDEEYSAIAEFIPYFEHFADRLVRKWKKIRKEYPELNDLERPPCIATLYEWDEVSEAKESLMQRQKIGLIYGGLTDQVNVSMAQLLLVSHGVIRHERNEVTGAEGGPLQITQSVVSPIEPIDMRPDEE